VVAVVPPLVLPLLVPPLLVPLVVSLLLVVPLSVPLLLRPSRYLLSPFSPLAQQCFCGRRSIVEPRL
jgi:hypothetical protein